MAATRVGSWEFGWSCLRRSKPTPRKKNGAALVRESLAIRRRCGEMDSLGRRWVVEGARSGESGISAEGLSLKYRSQGVMRTQDCNYGVGMQRNFACRRPGKTANKQLVTGEERAAEIEDPSARLGDDVEPDWRKRAARERWMAAAQEAQTGVARLVACGTIKF